jgi:hypothetical protein
MSRCTAPIEGHRTQGGRDACPACRGQGTVVPPVTLSGNDFARKLRENDLRQATDYGAYFQSPKPGADGVPTNSPKPERLDAAENLFASYVFDPASIYSTAAEELLRAAKRGVRYWLKGQHWLCEILWEAAELLSGAKAAGIISDSVAKICTEAGLPRFVGKVMGKVASKAIDASIPGAPAQVANLLRGIVAVICSNPDRCEYGKDANNFLLKPGVEAQLRALAGTSD